jgi:flagellar biogenesis protein FliO
MSFIVLSLTLVLLLLLVGAVLVKRKRQRGGSSERHLQDLTAVSTQWLADRKRAG